MQTVKPVIYQLLPRLFTNYCAAPIVGGSIQQNGSGKLNDISDHILNSIKNLGATHIWYTGVIEHAHTPDYSAYGIAPHNCHIVKGKAGSPYAITDYYDIDPDLAVDVPHRMAEFEALVERTHRAGLNVIIDFVPNHVGRQYHSDAKPAGVDDFGSNDNTNVFFAPDNNFYYITYQQFSPNLDLGSGDEAYVEFPAKASGNDCFYASPGKDDWYETVKLNYGIDYSNGATHFSPMPDTWVKMIEILKFWASKGVDGFRCDMAHMVPLEFWRTAIDAVRSVAPDIKFIAEIYDVALYRPFIESGFDYLYDKVNLYDTLRAVETNRAPASAITGCWQAVDGINDYMLNFLENHDEQRFASSFYSGDAMHVLPSLVVSALMSRGPMMIYFGQELGEPGADAEGYSGYDGRTTIFDYWSVASVRRWLNEGCCDGYLSDNEKALRDIYSRVLRLCNDEQAISHGGFFDLMYVNYYNARFNPYRHYAFLRHYGDTVLVIIANFDNIDCDIAVNIPSHAFECLQIGEITDNAAIEMLSATKAYKELSPLRSFEAFVPAHGAVIWKLKTIKHTNS